LDKIDTEIIALLRSLDGVIHAGRVSDALRKRIVEHEERHSNVGPISVDNIGVKSAAKCDRLYFIVKDRKFRPPSIATVRLIAEDGTVLGEEIIRGKMPKIEKGEKTVNLGKDFIIYYSKAKEKGRNCRFVLPPVPFPELEKRGFTLRVISCSPSTLGDSEVKKSLGIGDDPKLASILVGIDLR